MGDFADEPGQRIHAGRGFGDHSLCLRVRVGEPARDHDDVGPAGAVALAGTAELQDRIRRAGGRSPDVGWPFFDGVEAAGA